MRDERHKSGGACNPEAQTQNAVLIPNGTRMFEERHYTIAEIAELWSLSRDSVTRLFEKEPGVLALGTKKPRGKRRYLTLRISESVLERVYRENLVSLHSRKG